MCTDRARTFKVFFVKYFFILIEFLSDAQVTCPSTYIIVYRTIAWTDKYGDLYDFRLRIVYYRNHV